MDFSADNFGGFSSISEGEIERSKPRVPRVLQVEGPRWLRRSEWNRSRIVSERVPRVLRFRAVSAARVYERGAHANHHAPVSEVRPAPGRSEYPADQHRIHSARSWSRISEGRRFSEVL